jgi:hypothetical protein
VLKFMPTEAGFAGVHRLSPSKTITLQLQLARPARISSFAVGVA